MAKYEKIGYGNFNDVVLKIDKLIREGSLTVTKEEESSLTEENIKFKMITYERYSYFGKNRSSLSVSFLELSNNRVFVAASATGASQAVLIKINKFSDASFLKTAIEAINQVLE